jgi:hypothetical protein
MPIQRDLSHLPAAEPGIVGTSRAQPPDTDPWLVRALLTKAVEHFDTPYERAMPELPFRHSQAGHCVRQIAYEVAEVEETNPRDIPSLWVMGLGNLVHDVLQEFVHEIYPGAAVEVTIDGRVIDLPGSGHTDFTIEAAEDELPVSVDGPKRVVVELKTIGGFGYKLAATTFKGPPQGPRWSALAQGAINAAASDADVLILVYIGMEAVSPGLVGGIAGEADVQYLRVGSQWTYTREQFEPIAAKEAKRFARIAELIEKGQPIPRSAPGDDGRPFEISIPKAKDAPWVRRGPAPDRAITESGKTWMCGYCAFLDRCAGEPEFVVEIKAKP